MSEKQRETMKRFIHYFIGLIGFIFLPCFWLGFNSFPPYNIKIGISELFNEWWEHMKSDKPWGVFDE